MAVLDFFLTHKHYWGVPHRRADHKLVQTCYGCSKEREVAVDFNPAGDELKREHDTAVALLYTHEPAA